MATSMRRTVYLMSRLSAACGTNEHLCNYLRLYNVRSFANIATAPATDSNISAAVDPELLGVISSSTSAADMAKKIKRYKPTTPGIRHLVTIDRSELWNGSPFKPLTFGKRKTGGRNNLGRITVRHIGGGHKQRMRIIDFKRDKIDMKATVQRLEYDPNRSAHIALLRYQDGEIRYILAPHDLQPGEVIQSTRTENIDIKRGNAMPLSNMPIGTFVYNVELQPGRGGQIARSAGSYAQVLDKNVRSGFVLLQLCSKEHRLVKSTCLASVGVASNPLHKLRNLGKAGRNRWLGRRPRVRAVAMNPVDHPMGGGFNAKGRHPCSPTGVLAKGFRTRSKKKHNPHIVMRRFGRMQSDSSRM